MDQKIIFMLEQLFGSKTRLKMLKVFFQYPERAFYVRELQRLLDTQINAIRREIETLLSCDLVLELEKEEVDKKKTSIEKAEDNAKAGSNLRKYYQLNTNSVLYEEMHGLLLKSRALAEQKFTKDIEEKGGEINLLLLTGRFTGESNAKSDILIVGNVRDRVIAKIISAHEKEYNASMRYTIMSPEEFLNRRHVLDKFLFSLFEGRHIKIIDTFGI